jgi:carboxymethylenebutenolidase
MPERKLEIPGADGVAEAFLYTPSGAGPWPGVLFFTDIFGIRPANQGMAQRVADAGYAVLMPNVFYRLSRLPLIDFEFKMGDPRSMQMLQALKDALTSDQMKRDVVAFADDLLTQDEVTGLKAGAVGYCFTGKMALFAASESPDKLAAAASFHGGGLVSDAPDSPHTVLPKVKSELYFGHAVEDPSMTPAQIEKLDDALKGWGGACQSEIYEGAKHGWTVPGRDVFNEKQAERHYAKLIDLLKRTLG